jgi:hypothetical protein
VTFIGVGDDARCGISSQKTEKTETGASHVGAPPDRQPRSDDGAPHDDPHGRHPGHAGHESNRWRFIVPRSDWVVSNLKEERCQPSRHKTQLFADVTDCPSNCDVSISIIDLPLVGRPLFFELTVEVSHVDRRGGYRPYTADRNRGSRNCCPRTSSSRRSTCRWRNGRSYILYSLPTAAAGHTWPGRPIT